MPARRKPAGARKPRTSPRRRIAAVAAGSRTAIVERKTKETAIRIRLALDGAGASKASTGIPFFDHMLEQLGRHAGFDLDVRAVGDLEVDAHHTVEDVGIAMGEAVSQALGAKVGIRRFGSALVPLDEALLQVALDISSRPFLVHTVDAKAKLIGTYDTRLTEEFLRAFAQAARATIHVTLLAGRNPHHIVEAEFKALAKALGDAVSVVSGRGLPSTKGKL